MRNFAVGSAAVFALAALSYAALAAFQNDSRTPVAAAVRLTPQQLAARDRMAQLVAEVAAHTAAQTAREVVINHSRPQQLAAAAPAQKSAGR